MSVSPSLSTLPMPPTSLKSWCCWTCLREGRYRPCPTFLLVQDTVDKNGKCHIGNDPWSPPRLHPVQDLGELGPRNPQVRVQSELCSGSASQEPKVLGQHRNTGQVGLRAGWTRGSRLDGAGPGRQLYPVFTVVLRPQG